MAERSDRVQRSPQGRVPWFVVLAGPVVGILHEALGYLIVARGCVAGVPWFSLGPAGSVRVMVWILGAVAEVLLVAAAVAGFRRWRRGKVSAGRDTVAAERNQFLALTGTFMSLGFALFVLLSSLPAAFVDPCLR